MEPNLLYVFRGGTRDGKTERYAGLAPDANLWFQGGTFSGPTEFYVQTTEVENTEHGRARVLRYHGDHAVPTSPESPS